MSFSLPLMANNITAEDRAAAIEFLKGDPILTQSSNVRAFEQEWSAWLGVRRSVFVNSGASANFITMAALRHLRGPGEVVVPTLTWVSDVSSVLAAGHRPVFVDVNPRTLAMDPRQVVAALTPRTRAVFLTHCQGFDGLDDDRGVDLELVAPPTPDGRVRDQPVSGDAQGADAKPPLTARQRRSELRDRNASLARDLARRANMTHAQVNRELNRLSGVTRISEATEAQLQRRLDEANRWSRRVR